MIQLMNNEVYILKKMAQDSGDVCLLSSLEGHMGKVWSDCNKMPQLGFIVVADFCYILGKCKGQEDEQSISNLLEYAKGKLINRLLYQMLPRMLTSPNTTFTGCFQNIRMKD